MLPYKCPHCGKDLEEPLYRFCPHCNGNIKDALERYQKDMKKQRVDDMSHSKTSNAE